MRARLTIELEAHEWYPGEPVTATLALPPLSYGVELLQARLDADSPVLPKSWRDNPAALVGARIAATALRLPLSAVIATTAPLSTPDNEPAAAGPPAGTGADEPPPAPRMPWDRGTLGRRARRLVAVLRGLTWVGLAVTVLGLAYGWARYR